MRDFNALIAIETISTVDRTIQHLQLSRFFGSSLRPIQRNENDQITFCS